jgi:hypothetical protein
VSTDRDKSSSGSREFAGKRSKAALRRELEQATRQFLNRGGEVTSVPSGASAWEPGTRPPPSRPLFTEPREERTPIPEVVATLEARREAMKQKAQAGAEPTRPTPAASRGLRRLRRAAAPRLGRRLSAVAG